MLLPNLYADNMRRRHLRHGRMVRKHMAANKCRGIRAAVCHDNYSAERSILSNNGNVLCLGARIIGPELAKKVVGEWISLEFVDSPSTVKVADILRIEQENFKS